MRELGMAAYFRYKRGGHRVISCLLISSDSFGFHEHFSSERFFRNSKIPKVREKTLWGLIFVTDIRESITWFPSETRTESVFSRTIQSILTSRTNFSWTPDDAVKLQRKQLGGEAIVISYSSCRREKMEGKWLMN